MIKWQQNENLENQVLLLQQHIYLQYFLVPVVPVSFTNFFLYILIPFERIQGKHLLSKEQNKIDKIRKTKVKIKSSFFLIVNLKILTLFLTTIKITYSYLKIYGK